MSDKLAEATKEVLGYTQVVRSCKRCKYFHEVKKPDDKFDWVCNYSNICSFTVSLFGCCDKFEREQ